MFNIFQHVGPEIPLTLILLAALGLRAKVTPRASVWVNVLPEKLWALLDVYDGKTENWGRTKVITELIDATSQTYLKTYATSLANGMVRPFTAKFQISQRQPNRAITLLRSGLDGKSPNNELLKITHNLTPEKGGTRLVTVYYWGPRTLMAQLLARTDLWSGAFRLKGQAETGIANERPYVLISLGVTLVTGLLSVLAFGLILNFTIAWLLVLALFVHEFGHLLAYKLMGQPWGRLIFLPFLGAMAMPRLPFQSQGQSVFAALMGPGFSVVLALACAAPWFLHGYIDSWLAITGLVTAGLNIFNLLPAEPLDGGVALRSVLTRLIGNNARYGLIAVGILIAIVGFSIDQLALVIFGGMAILANLRTRTIDAGLTPLSSLQMAIAGFGYAAIITAHITMLQFFFEKMALLQS